MRRVSSGLILFAALVCGTAVAADIEVSWNVRDHIPLGKFLIQSHRGAGELEAENTVEAFELAWKLGTVPEADVCATKDGVIVAFHDTNFRRLVKDAPAELAGKGVKDVTWDELSRFDVGTRKAPEFAGRKVPRLADVFRKMTGRPERRLYLDVKEVDLAKLAGEVEDARVGAQVILASPRPAELRRWKELVPESGTLLWMGGTEEELTEKLTDVRATGFAGITQLQIHVRVRPGEDGGGLTPSPEFLAATGRELRERGILFQTLPWETTDPAVYRRLLDLGVASFATDHPKLTLDAVRGYYESRGR